MSLCLPTSESARQRLFPHTKPSPSHSTCKDGRKGLLDQCTVRKRDRRPPTTAKTNRQAKYLEYINRGHAPPEDGCRLTTLVSLSFPSVSLFSAAALSSLSASFTTCWKRVADRVARGRFRTRPEQENEKQKQEQQQGKAASHGRVETKERTTKDDAERAVSDVGDDDVIVVTQL